MLSFLNSALMKMFITSDSTITAQQNSPQERPNQIGRNSPVPTNPRRGYKSPQISAGGAERISLAAPASVRTGSGRARTGLSPGRSPHFGLRRFCGRVFVCMVPVYLSVPVSVCVSAFARVCFCLFFCPCFCLSTCLYVCLYVCLSICFSLPLSVCL